MAPAGIGFMDGSGIGPQYDGDLFVGAARPFLEGGFLWHFNLTGNRRRIGVDDPRLEDVVADNLNKPSPDDPMANAQAFVESESLLFGRNFGVATDIQTGPNGNLFVVSLSNGAIYEILGHPNEMRSRKDRIRRLKETQAPLSFSNLLLVLWIPRDVLADATAAWRRARAPRARAPAPLRAPRWI